jgi:hypothetical protein
MREGFSILCLLDKVLAFGIGWNLRKFASLNMGVERRRAARAPAIMS